MITKQNDFDSLASNYQRFRPNYPIELYAYLSTLVNEHNLVWDCGTGNGQAALPLAEYFDTVIATDSSQNQLACSAKKSNIKYICCTAGETPLANHSVNLITVAQALHWFDLNAFYHEASRVLKADGIIAVWGYSIDEIDSPFNHLLKKLYSDILGVGYWPAQRRYLDEKYQTIAFPFTDIKTPIFTMTRDYHLADLLGYLQTWTAVHEFQRRNHEDPIRFIYEDLVKAWGDPETKYRIHTQLHLRVGKK